ncbi:MAG: hypothetical protein FWF34_01915 [Alphaproteobacteria bacterium]|nr:hypothetical protein [Alphaproteobacteria bacterium]MCL2889989.1 hypothetical protein [Alphaproteobacteria bacterium]
MNGTLSDFLKSHESQKHATDAGTVMHKRLQHVIIDGQGAQGDAMLAKKITAQPKIARFFASGARTEVPIAGKIREKFISRRIDRMIISDTEIEFLDYKTDTDKSARRDLYAAQMAEYAALLRAAFPGRAVRGYILWLSDWELEKIVENSPD